MRHDDFKKSVDAAIADRLQREHRTEFEPSNDPYRWNLGRVTVTLVVTQEKTMGDYTAIRTAEPNDLMGHSTTIVPIRADENGVRAIVEMIFSPW